MKKSSAWLLLTTYLCASCAGMLPLALDVVAHVLWHKEHIEHVHQGKEDHGHVAVEMAQMLHENQNNGAVLSEMNGGKVNLSAHYCPLPVFESSELQDWQFVPFPLLRFNLPTGVESTIFLPPEMA
ncbi:MAG: hypothetical protein IPH31_06820 [Lewinellaceae bacterium]|nr:hypothetical protein [Lewinellaceae bacterium]